MENHEQAKLIPNGYFGSKYSLSWHNLNVYVNRRTGEPSFWRTEKYERMQIVKNVTGSVSSASLTAVMGPSGAGKTSFLVAVACRTNSEMSGSIRLNGKMLTKSVMLEISTFLPQHDTTFDSLTVHEHLTIMAKLKMDRRLKESAKMYRVQCLIEEFGISDCASTRIQHLSGGQKKRLSLAVQLLTDPLIVFCDEPTTGLDSYNARTVLLALRESALKGKIVVCSIHQPASENFQLFDKVFLMATGGRIAYQGSVAEIADYFSRLGMMCPSSCNIAEFIVCRVSITSTKGEEHVERICDECESRVKCSSLQTLLAADTELYTAEEFVSKKAGNAWAEFLLLTRRYSIHLLRDNTHHVIDLFGLFFVAIVIVIYYKDVTVSSENVHFIQGYIVVAVLQCFFVYAYRAVGALDRELPIMLRELNSGVFKRVPYFLSQVFLRVCYSIVEATIFSAAIYFPVSMFKHVPFLLFTLPLVVTTVFATCYGMMILPSFKNLNRLSAIMHGYEMTSYMTAGYLANLNTLPSAIRWLRYCSVFFYPVESMSIIEWSNVYHMHCTSSNSSECKKDGRNVLQYYGYQMDGYAYYDLLFMITFSIIFIIIAYKVISYRSKSVAY